MRRGRSKRPARRAEQIYTVLLTAAFAVALVVFVAATVARGTFLSADYYTDALARNEVYDRIYEEVLADPELAATHQRLLGDAPVPPQLQIAALRLVLPPDRLRIVTEEVIGELTTYLRGDRARFLGEVDVTTVLDEVQPTAMSFVEDRVAALPSEAVGTFEELVGRLQPFAQAIARGDLPATIPMTPELPVDPTEGARRLLSVLGQQPSDAVIRQVAAALASGDLHGAIERAAGEFAVPQAVADVAELRSSLGEGDRFASAASLASAGGQTVAGVVDQLDGVRAVTRRISPAVQYAALGIMVATLVALGFLSRRRGRSPVLLPALVALASGLFVLAAWTILSIVVAGPLEDAVSQAKDGWGLPDSVRRVLADVRSTLGSELTGAVRRPTVVLVLLAGATALVAVAVERRWVVKGARGRQSRGLAVAATAMVTVLLVGLVLVRPLRTNPPMACNGHVELCDRPFNEVAFAASHNSMSAADIFWIWPEHDRGIVPQLEWGIRALLIDTHYWQDAAQIAAYQQSLPPPAAAVVGQVLGNVDPPRPGTFLCHNLCQLGALSLVEKLGDVREFLSNNPHEVLTLFIQDAISPGDTEAAIRESGLLPFVYVHEHGKPWPTLGEMIDDGTRLLVMAEEEGPPPPWYHQGFQLTQETQFQFSRPEDFNCLPNRGSPDSPLFLLNHWIEADIAATRTAATVVNARDVLLPRARRCQEERGRIPNFVAVDFYSIGDVVGVVDELNGLR